MGKMGHQLGWIDAPAGGWSLGMIRLNVCAVAEEEGQDRGSCAREAKQNSKAYFQRNFQ